MSDRKTHWTQEEINKTSHDTILAQHHELVPTLKAFLAQKHPVLVGMALAELTGIWLASHNPEVREAIMKRHFKQCAQIAGLVSPELWNDDGDPA